MSTRLPVTVLAIMVALCAQTAVAAARPKPNDFTVYKHRTSMQMLDASTGTMTTDVSGATTGDTELIYGTVARTPGGKVIGHYRGIATMFSQDPQTGQLTRWFRAKISLPGGAIFIEDAQANPTVAAAAAGMRWTYAVVGGTGLYDGVTGECLSVLIREGVYFKDTFHLYYPR